MDGATTGLGDRKLKLIVGSAALVATYCEHSAASHRATWANTICHVSEGRQGASPPRHRGARLAALHSQMRSHVGRNGRAEPVNQKSHIQRHAVETWEMAGSPARQQEEEEEEEDWTPPSCHASAHHTSHKLHAPFHLECGRPGERNGIAGAFRRLLCHVPALVLSGEI